VRILRTFADELEAGKLNADSVPPEEESSSLTR
jgi:hypothetical protein